MPLLCFEFEKGWFSNMYRRRARRGAGDWQSDLIDQMPQRRRLRLFRRHRDRWVGDGNRAQQGQRIVRTVMRWCGRLPVFVHIDNDRAGACTQHHLTHGPVHAARNSKALPGQNQKQGQNIR